MAFSVVITAQAGTITTTVNSNLVSGSGTAFTAAMVGQIINTGSQYALIVSVNSSTQLTIDRTSWTAVSGAAWGIGATITQSGTDTSYAGLNGIAGVTRIATGTGYLYYMPTLVLSITGTLTIADPSKDTIICSRYSVTGTGNVRSGTFAADGVTPLTSGTHFSAVTYPSTWSGDTFGTGSYEVAPSGQATFIGGSYQVAGNMFIGNGAIIREYGVDVVALASYVPGQTASDSVRIRAYGSNVVKKNCRHYDIGYDLFRIPTGEFSVKAFGSVYVAQYVGGSYSGGAHGKFVASALSNIDGTTDFDNWGGGWVELYNCGKGANLNVNASFSRLQHCVPLFQDVNIKVTNLAGTVQNNVRYRFIDAPVSNNPTTTITTAGGGKTWDFRSPITYQGTTDASGASTISPALQVWHGASNLKNLRFPSSTISPEFRAYGLVTQSASLVLGSDTAQALPMAMTAINYLTLTEAQVLALTGITFTPSGATGGTVVVSSARTIVELWQYYRAWISQFANFGSNDTWTYDGTNLSIGAWTISGIENLSVGKITTSSATANGAFTIGVVGNVTQATPTNLNGVVLGRLTISSGTIRVAANGIVTGTGTAFTADMVGSEITINGVKYQVTAFTSATSITIRDIANSATYSGAAITVDTAYILNYAGNLIYNTNTDITVTLTNSSISGTISNSGTGNVKLNLVNSTVNTGTRVTAQYPITVTDANGANFSTQIWVFNSGGNIIEDTGFNSLVASKTVYMPVGGSIRVYSQAYGTQSKITNTNATNASLVITHIPETLVDTSLPTATRNTVAGYFSSVVENSLLYVEVDTDLGGYTPAEVLNAMHYFIVSNGGNFAALSLLANTVGSVQLIDGGFRVYSAFFKGRAKSNLNATNTPSLYITLPLYIEDASGVAGNQVMVRNTNGIDVHAALWSKATANISQNDMNSIAGTTWSHNKRTLNDAIFE